MLEGVELRQVVVRIMLKINAAAGRMERDTCRQSAMVVREAWRRWAHGNGLWPGREESIGGQSLLGAEQKQVRSRGEVEVRLESDLTFGASNGKDCSLDLLLVDFGEPWKVLIWELW